MHKVVLTVEIVDAVNLNVYRYLCKLYFFSSLIMVLE